MKKGMRIVITVLCLFAISAGCSQNKADTIKEEGEAFGAPQYKWGEVTGETLSVWGVYPDLERSYIEKAFKRYTEFTGNQLDIVQMEKREFEERMSEAFNQNKEKPDIILTYGGTNIEAYGPDENFYDFTDAQWVDDLTDTSISQTVYNGKIIGLPHWEASISGTIYNKTLFKKYNLQIPKTQDEFMKVCEVFSKNGITPVYMPGKEITMLLYQFPMDAVLEDSSLLEGLNSGSLSYADIPEMETIITWYKTMASKGYFGDSYMTDDWGGMTDAMSSGKYAMMLCWDTWLYTDYEGNPGEFGLMPAFIGVPDKGTFEGPNLGLFMVNKYSPKLKAALDFITFLSDPYNYNAVFEGIYTAPVFKNQVDSISTPQYLESERLIERNYRDSVSWLRVRGFSQLDAACILDYMNPESDVTAAQCLENMDKLREKRLDY